MNTWHDLAVAQANGREGAGALLQAALPRSLNVFLQEYRRAHAVIP